MYNQYNPYNSWGMNNYMGNMSTIPKMRNKFNWNNILNNTQRTLGIINQAIPLVYQMKPLVNNARTLFRIAGAVNSSDKEETVHYNDNYQETNSSPNEDDQNKSNLRFFL